MLIIGHRGASGNSPENTIESFQKAILMHAGGIEFDVHLTSDQEIVVIHDDSVDRTTSGKGLVQNMSLRQLQELKIDNRLQIPTLKQVLDLSSEILMNIELKGENTAEPVAKLIEKYVAQKDRSYAQFIVSSFDWKSLQWIREYYPEIPLGVLTHTDLHLAISFAKFIKAQAIHPHFHLLNKENTLDCQRKGIKIYTWTVNQNSDIELVKSFAPDGIITDFPDRI